MNEEVKLMNKRTSSNYIVMKRILDVMAALVGIALIVVTSVILYIPYHMGKNKGKMFFKQQRIGKDGELFEIYKFRSMRENADVYLYENKELYKKYIENGYKLEQHEDPRITKLGAFLRTTSIDELPQFINVLKGEMSMVGPRPIIEEELDEYKKKGKVEEFLSMKPGITGVWQTSGRSNVQYPERVYLEISYAENQSIFTDLSIIIKTCVKVLKKEGAY